MEERGRLSVKKVERLIAADRSGRFALIVAATPVLTGNGPLGEQQQEMLAVFRSLDPRKRRILC
jgi:hypothetical protein